MDTTWSNTTRILIITLILAGAIWLAFVASPLLDAILLAALLAYLLNPLVCSMARRSTLKRSQAAVVVFLLSPAAAYISGESIKIDGAGSLWRKTWEIDDHDHAPPPYDGFAAGET